MTKVKSKSVSAWKPLKLEGQVLSDGLEGLIGIEELSDYKLEEDVEDSRILVCDKNIMKKKKTAAKHKHTNEWKEDTAVSAQPPPKKIKWKEAQLETKGKKTKLMTKKSSSEKEVNNNNDNDSEEEDESTLEEINYQEWSRIGVPTSILKALVDQHFVSPTAIQSLTLPPAILGRRDILGAAETGSGKTLAFGIPILNGILNLKEKYDATENDSKNSGSGENKGWICSTVNSTNNEDSNDSESDLEEEEEEEEEENVVNGRGIGCVNVIDNIEITEPQNFATKPLYALILTPTRELAIQIKNHLTKAAKYTDIKIAVVVGGMAAVKQERILSKGPEIVIATPGRLWELIQQGNPHLNQVDSIKYLAIDETDRMLEKGHFQELQQLLEKINASKIKLQERQTFVFSATLTLVHDIPDYLQRKKQKHTRSRIFKLTPGQKLQKIIHLVGIKNPKIVDITKETGTANNLTECRIACTIDHKDYYLYYFLKRHSGRTLVFCNSIGCVKRLATLFGILECKPLPLHASMQQRQRLKNLEKFQADENGLLIATDVAARGLDIPNVEHVIHYQVPRTSESYVHRSGRTARADKEGITILMMEPSEKQFYSKLCKTLGRTQDLPNFPVVDRLLIAVKERVNIARQIDKLELKCRRDNSQKGWIRKAVEDMDMVLDEDGDDEEIAHEAEETAGLKHELKIKKHQLATLLKKTLFPKGFSGKYLDNNLEVELNESGQKAVEVMKQSIKDMPQKKKEMRKTVQKKLLIKKNKKYSKVKKMKKSKKA